MILKYLFRDAAWSYNTLRYKDDYEYITIVDLDEFLVPHIDGVDTMKVD